MYHHISKYCTGQKCGTCGKSSTHKVGEEIPDDDPTYGMRHNYTQYVCCKCFYNIFGQAVMCTL